MVLGPPHFRVRDDRQRNTNVPGANRPVRNIYSVVSSYSRLRVLVCSRQFDRAVEIVQRLDGLCD
jgi:hypothetical protein